MEESLRVSRRIYIRAIRFFIPLTAVFAASVVFLISLNKATNDLEYLKDSLQLGVLGTLFFAVSTYELMSLSRRVGSEEVIAAQLGAKSKLSLAHILTQLLILALWGSIVLFGNIIRYASGKTGYAPFYFHIAKCVLLYCMVPGCIAILLGCVISRLNRPAAYTLIIVFTFLSSPIPLRLFSWYQINGFPIAQVLDWFQLSVPNSHFVSDSVYGLGLERSRWTIGGFWAFLLAVLSLIVLKEKTSWKHRALVVSLSVVTLFFAVTFSGRHDDYIMCKDSRPDGMIYSERNYRLNENTAVAPQKADYAIKSYELNFCVDGSLSCNATLNLEDNTLSEYAITLYHGYVISTVTNLNGDPLEYRRDGDYLTVYTTKPLDGIKINYRGNSSKYYANNQAIVLPGYFPYYPMPGHISLWDDSSSSFIPVTSMQETLYNVSVSASHSVISNLPATARNVFSGYSNGLTLYAGFVTLTERGNTKYCFSPLSGQTIDLPAEALSAEWTDITKKLNIDQALSIEDKIVFYQPFTIRSAAGNQESVVVMDDHILVCDLTVSPGNICSRYLMQLIPQNKETATLRDLFYLYFYEKPEITAVMKPDYSELEILTRISSPSEAANEEEMTRYILAEESFADLVLYQIKTLGEEYTLSQIYAYLTAETVTKNQVDFLYHLGGD